MVIAVKKSSAHFEFRSSDLKTELKPLCDRVLRQFSKFPPLRLLCFVDNEDFESLQQQGFFEGMPAPVMGIHTPIIGGGTWPNYISNHFLDSRGEFAFDDLIYIPQSKYLRQEVAFTIILAHELQHFVQRGFAPRISEANALLLWNLADFDPMTTLQPWGLPNNREAMIVAKRVAEAVCGKEAVKSFCDTQLEDGKRNNNSSKTQLWLWVRSLQQSASYDLIKETDQLVQKYKPQLQDLKSDIDFSTSNWWL